MPDNPDTPEGVALALLLKVLEEPDMKEWVLGVYAECLRAVTHLDWVELPRKH